MASFRGTRGVMAALDTELTQRLKALLGGNPKVSILGSQDLITAPAGDALGIYLHRIAVDPFGRNRYLPPANGRRAPRPELPVTLHLLLVGWAKTREAEVDLLSGAMQVIGSALVLDVARLALHDSAWGEGESVQVIPEEMSTEDLMRIWDSLPGDYRLSTPYLVKNLRLGPDRDPEDLPLVRSLVFPMDDRTEEPA